MSALSEPNPAFGARCETVAAALGRASVESGIAVMNAVNITVYNPGFMALFMGVAAASLLLAFGSYACWDSLDGKLLLLICGSVSLTIGPSGTTFGQPLRWFQQSR